MHIDIDPEYSSSVSSFQILYSLEMDDILSIAGTISFFLHRTCALLSSPSPNDARGISFGSLLIQSNLFATKIAYFE